MGGTHHPTIWADILYLAGNNPELVDGQNLTLLYLGGVDVVIAANDSVVFAAVIEHIRHPEPAVNLAFIRLALGACLRLSDLFVIIKVLDIIALISILTGEIDEDILTGTKDRARKSFT